MRVQVIQNVSFLHKGEKYGPGDIIEEFNGKLDKYIRQVGAAPKPKPTQPKEETQPKEALMESKPIIDKPITRTEEGTEVLATFDEEINLSPEMIKAKIAEIESKSEDDSIVFPDDVTDVIVPDDVEEEVEKVEYNVVEVGRGWYEVHDANGKSVSEKKMRRDDAESLLEELYA